MGDKTRRFTAKEIERLLSDHGFELVSQASGRQVIVPFHAGKTLPLGTLRNILLNAEIPESEWRP